MTNKFPSVLILLTLFTLSSLTGCKKATDPCEGLLNEGPLSEIMVRCIDKQSKEALVIDAAFIKITEKKSGNPYTNWNVLNRSGLPQLNGAIVLPIFNETPGEYQYNIQVADAGTLTLSYQISREQTDNVCRPYSYPMRDIRIVNQKFDVFQYEGKTYPKILIVEL